jgi:hypothetical protein
MTRDSVVQIPTTRLERSNEGGGGVLLWVTEGSLKRDNSLSINFAAAF